MMCYLDTFFPTDILRVEHSALNLQAQNHVDCDATLGITYNFQVIETIHLLSPRAVTGGVNPKWTRQKQQEAVKALSAVSNYFTQFRGTRMRSTFSGQSPMVHESFSFSQSGGQLSNQLPQTCAIGAIRTDGQCGDRTRSIWAHKQTNTHAVSTVAMIQPLLPPH